MSGELVFTFVMGVVVLVAIVGTYDNTRKTARLLEKTNKMIEEMVRKKS